MNTTSLTTSCRHRLRITSIILTVVGVLLLACGAASSDSLGATFSGAASTRSLLLLGGGLLALAAGAFGAFRFRKD